MERRRRILMVAGLLTGGLMLAVAAILVGGAFSRTSLTPVGLPEHRRSGPTVREPGVIESRLTRYRVPDTRPVGSASAAPTPVPTPAAKKTPAPSASSRTPRPEPSPSRTAAASSATPRPAKPATTPLTVQESALSDTLTKRAAPGKTKKPRVRKHPKHLK